MNINKFFLIIIATIVIVQVWLWLFPKHGPAFFGFRPHHYLYGVIMVLIFCVFYKPALIAVGLGLIIDELSLFFIFRGFNWPDNHWQQYHSWQNLVSIAAILIVSYLLVVRLLKT